METGVLESQQVCFDPFSFARSYQLEALDKAINQNTIVFLETGSGKTLIAIMLLRNYAYLLRKPTPFIAIFLVPTVVLVTQQAEVVKMHTDLKVGKYWGEMGVDYWSATDWKDQQDEYEVLVMTPMILLNALRHSFLKLEMIKVLIFDECHNARGRHPYACIMTEFYHRQLDSNNSQQPRIFGMTASPVKAKGSSSELTYWKQIHELENLMNSKVYTCVSESVIAEYIPFSTAKLKSYKHMDIPYPLFANLANALNTLKEKHESSIVKANLSVSVLESARRRLSKVSSTFFFCLSELGVWLALKAAETLLFERSEIFSWGELDVCGEKIVRNFSSDVFKVFSKYIPSDPDWSIGGDMKVYLADRFLSTKVICLVESLLEYRDLKDLRCIIFVERVITAIVLCTLLTKLLPSLSGWKIEYTAGQNTGLQTQSRKTQNKIVEEFRKGTVNIIVATSILEEGLDVQSCNLVVRFDPSATVCSFIQSRGRARMQNSDFLLLVKSGDTSTLARLNNYLASGNIMRQESLRHASVPCQPLDSEIYNEVFYQVDTTGAIVTLSSSVSLVYFYCSRLPSDGYFKPFPRCDIDKESETCTLYFPKSCPLPSVTVHGNIKSLKQLACLEACKQLHKMGSLTDNLVPDMLEEVDAEELGYGAYVDEFENYVPPELVSQGPSDSKKSYHCYLIELERNFDYDIPLHNVVIAVRTELKLDDDILDFGLEADKGSLTVHMKYVGVIDLTSEQVLLCHRFQVMMFRVLLDNNFNKVKETLGVFCPRNNIAVFDYLLLPSTGSQQSLIIDWGCVGSILFPSKNLCHDRAKCSPKCRNNIVHTINGLVCRCVVENSLVCTPHNGYVYCITRTLDGLDGNSMLELKNGETITYKKYYQKRHGVDLHFEREQFLKGRHVFPVQNHVQKCRGQKERERSNASVELPPELCSIIMSPISVSTFYSFSFAPSIMHRIESLLIASSLKKMHSDHCTKNVIPTSKVPTIKVLEAITTKKCQEKFHLESLETLGDSFLKYAACQQLFKTHQNKHEGILSARKDKIISNASLCKLGCSRKLPGFIRNEPFDPKMWIVPGDYSKALDEESLSTTTKVFTKGRRKIKSKVVADVVEALIGAFLSNGGEVEALSFMDWLGIKVDFLNVPYVRNFPVQPEKLLNIKYLESVLNYSFRDTSLLVEALTHGSYMLPQIPRCYQRLEFLGDSVLDYLITRHLYDKYPGISPGLLTDLRSASVNNDCYALSAIKVGLQKHVLHASQELSRHITSTVHDFDQLSLGSTFGWESENYLPKVLGDVIESLAGAILVDSGYRKDIVFNSIRPLLEPMISPETVRRQPTRELYELCQKEHFVMKKAVVSCENGKASITIEVEANGIIHRQSCTAPEKNMAKKLAAKAVLKSLKESISKGHVEQHVLGNLIHPIPPLCSPKGKKRKEDNKEST